MIHRCFIYIRWKVSCHFVSRKELLLWPSGAVVELASLMWTCGSSSRLRVVPHFSSRIVKPAKRECAWKSPHARKGDTRWGERKMRDYRQRPSFWTNALLSQRKTLISSSMEICQHLSKTRQPLSTLDIITIYRTKKGVITWDRDELGPVWVRIALHTFLFIRLHGTGLKTNSERSDFVSVADPTRVIFVRSEIVPFSCKTETNLRPGP